MGISVRYLTDPACPWSWGSEPTIRRLMVEFDEQLTWTYVMGGLARDLATGQGDPKTGSGELQGVYPARVAEWLELADRTHMPVDPRIWFEAPLASTYPACMAVKAAAQQADDGGYRYLRALREGIFCLRRKLDGPEALVEEARTAGLDPARFRVDLSSHATVEAFGADLEEARAVPGDARAGGHVETAGGRERLPLPTVLFTGDDGERHPVYGYRRYEDYRAAAQAAGARPRDEPPPSVLDALRRFGRMATREVEVVCRLPGPRASAALWQLASEWAVRPTRVLTGDLWEVGEPA